jgi:hypothetical protein
MRQKFAFTVLASFTCLTILLEPASGGSPELEKLNASYQRKIDEVVKPHRDRLLSDLLTKERSLAKAGNLEEALEIRKQRIACSLVTEPDDLLKSLPAGDAQIDSAVQVYLRHYRAGVRPWEKKYIEELRKLERNLSDDGRLEDAIEIKKQREKVELARNKREDPKPVPINLANFLPGRVYDYRGRENGKSKEILFLKGGRFYDYEYSFHAAWKVDGQKVTLSHPRWSSDTIVTFSDDGLSYKGKLSKTGQKRSGKFKEHREPGSLEK